MAEDKTATVSTNDGGAFVKRELSGATFLALEHVAHIVLVLVVATFGLSATLSAYALWTNGTVGTMPLADTAYGLSAGLVNADDGTSLWLVAALLVLSPLMAVFGRRVRAEWRKRPGFASRLAYKVPLYAAIGVSAAVLTGSVITLLSSVLSGILATNEWSILMPSRALPSLLMALVFGIVMWYFALLAKGKDKGAAIDTWLGLAALLIAFVQFAGIVHSQQSSPAPTVRPGICAYSHGYTCNY